MFGCMSQNQVTCVMKYQQEPTVPTTIRQIMSTHEFAQGVADARAGRPYPRGYDSWDVKTMSEDGSGHR